MKKLILLFINILIVQLANAQLVEITSGLIDPINQVFYENKLFISENNSGRIMEVDLLDVNPTPIEFFGGEYLFTALLVVGSDLYFCDRLMGTISKIDLTEPLPIPILVIDDLEYPNGLLKHNDELFICESTADRIIKIDLTDADPVPEVVSTNLDFPNGMVINGDDLYVVEPSANRVSKIDLSQDLPIDAEAVLTNLSLPAKSPIIFNNELYFSQYDINTISKINLADTNPVPVDVLTNLPDSPADLILVESDLYIIINDEGKIMKYSFMPLSTVGFEDGESAIVYPNPTTDFIQFKDFATNGALQIVNNKGQVVKEIANFTGTSVDVRGLATGTYILRNEDGVYVTFIKI